MTNQLSLNEHEKQLAIKEAWEIWGSLDYKLRNTQRTIKRAWISSKTKWRKFYVECTRRLGKSSFLLMLFTDVCLSSANRKCGFFAPVKDGLLDYIEPLILKTFEDCPDSLRPHFDRSRFVLRFKNGSTIVFRGSNNQQHRIRRGQEFHLAGIDEARDVDALESLIESVIFPSLFSTDGHLIISSTPADSRSHPLYSYRTQAEVEGWIIKIPIWEANRLDPMVYPLALVEEWKREILKTLNGQEIWEREFECKWVVNKTRIAVAEWNTKTMVQVFNRDPYYQFYHHYAGIDWGYKDFTAIVLATYNFRKARLEFDAELTYSGKEVRSDLLSERMTIAQERVWGKQYTMNRQVSDSADPILINELNRFKGMNFVPVQKAETLDAMLNEFRMLVAQEKVIVSPECQMLIHCLENGIWDENRKKLDQDVFAHHFDHLMAAVYLTRMVDWNTNPIPKDFMIDNVRVIDLDFDGNRVKGKSAQNLVSAFGGK